MTAVDHTHPYVKLSQTSLANRTSICGIPAKAASVVMAVLVLVFVSGSHLGLGMWLWKARPDYGDIDEDAHFRYKYYGERDDKFTQQIENRGISNRFGAAAILAIISGGATAITDIMLLFGAACSNPCLFSPWVFTTAICVVLGRLAPLLILSGHYKKEMLTNNPYVSVFIAMAFVDAFSIVLVVICCGQLIGVVRNKKYRNWNQGPRYNITSGGNRGGASKVLLPPGSYPTQQV